MSVIDSFTIKKTVADTPITEANYDRVDAAIAKAESLNKDDYKDFSAVEAAINAVVRGLDVSEQAQVDAMAEAIEEAIENLEKITDETPISPENPGTPQQPTEPDREEENLPSQSGNSENANENKPPHTSDATLMGLYYAILSVSACALLGAITYGRKKTHIK